MHPHTFYSTLFNQSKRDEVFVIMSFASEFGQRWVEIIEPCIREDLHLQIGRRDQQIPGDPRRRCPGVQQMALEQSDSTPTFLVVGADAAAQLY